MVGTIQTIIACRISYDRMSGVDYSIQCIVVYYCIVYSIHYTVYTVLCTVYTVYTMSSGCKFLLTSSLRKIVLLIKGPPEVKKKKKFDNCVLHF